MIYVLLALAYLLSVVLMCCFFWGADPDRYSGM